jgi:hypothetical protein
MVMQVTLAAGRDRSFPPRAVEVPMLAPRVRSLVLGLAMVASAASCVMPEPNETITPTVTQRSSLHITRLAGAGLVDRSWTGGLSYVYRDAVFAEDLWRALGSPRDVYCYSCEAQRYDLTSAERDQISNSYARMCYVAVVFGEGFEKSPNAMRELASVGKGDAPRLVVLLRNRPRTDAIPAGAKVIDATRLSAKESADSVRVQAGRAGCGPTVETSMKR